MEEGPVQNVRSWGEWEFQSETYVVLLVHCGDGRVTWMERMEDVGSSWWFRRVKRVSTCSDECKERGWMKCKEGERDQQKDANIKVDLAEDQEGNLRLSPLSFPNRTPATDPMRTKQSLTPGFAVKTKMHFLGKRQCKSLVHPRL